MASSGHHLAPKLKLLLQVLVDRLDVELAKESGKECVRAKHTGLGSPKCVLFEATDFYSLKILTTFSLRQEMGG